MTIFKVDCSNHDWGRGPMDVAAMRRDGIDIFIHKATDGARYYRDPYFAEALRRARDAGMPVTGAYHVLWNGNVVAQIDWFVDTVLAAAPWAASEPFEWMLDCEPFGYNGGAPSIATINAAHDRLVQRLPDHRPLAYAPRWVYGSLTGLRCPVVASNYGTNPATGYRQAYPGDSSNRWAAYSGTAAPVVLQYGSNTIVGGQRTVDANAYRGTVDQFRALISAKGEDFMAALSDAEQKELVRNGHNADWMGSAIMSGGDRELPQIGGKETFVVKNVLHQKIDAIQAALAADEVRDKATQVAIDGLVAAIQAGGGSVDAAPIVAAVQAVRDEARQEFAKLHAEAADLRAQLAAYQAREVAAAQAEADALKPTAG